MTNLNEIYSSMDENELLIAIENLQDYEHDTVDVILNEAKRRNISLPKIYYYRQEDKNSGPFNKIEIYDMAKEGTITENTSLWREGLDNWFLAKDFESLFFGKTNSKSTPPPFNQTASNNIKNNSKITGSIIACAILLIIYGVFWLVISIAQFTSEVYFPAIWNTVCSIVIWFDVYGLFTRKSWSYTAVLMVSIFSILSIIFEIYIGLLSFNPVILLVLIISIAILILISISKRNLTVGYEKQIKL